MKKTLTKLALILTASILCINLAYANTTTTSNPNNVNLETLFPSNTETLTHSDGKIGEKEIEAFKALPKVSAEQVVGSLILQILEWTFILTVIAIVVAAYYYLISRGNDEDITKAKNLSLIHISEPTRPY